MLPDWPTLSMLPQLQFSLLEKKICIRPPRSILVIVFGGNLSQLAMQSRSIVNSQL